METFAKNISKTVYRNSMKISAFIYWLIVVCMERFSLKICSCHGNSKQRFYNILGLVTMVTGEFYVLFLNSQVIKDYSLKISD